MAAPSLERDPAAHGGDVVVDTLHQRLEARIRPERIEQRAPVLFGISEPSSLARLLEPLQCLFDLAVRGMDERDLEPELESLVSGFNQPAMNIQALLEHRVRLFAATRTAIELREIDLLFVPGRFAEMLKKTFEAVS